MKICKTIAEIRKAVNAAKNTGKTIGLVPTMGALHNGHLKLIEEANHKCDLTIASIFVNPTQFNKTDDLENYPRTTSSDLNKLQIAKCDIVFIPSEKEIYPSKPSVSIEFGPIGGELEGKFRPGHFDGVGLVVSKLFNIIRPHEAFFGQKDLQQFFIIKALVDQLNFPIDLNMVPTLREENGLAMSSRNMRLSAADREEAALIHKALKHSQNKLVSGVTITELKREIKELFNSSERLALEYFEIIHTKDFKSVSKIYDDKNIALCIAAEIGQVRLIDNLMLIS